MKYQANSDNDDNNDNLNMLTEDDKPVILPIIKYLTQIAKRLL